MGSHHLRILSSMQGVHVAAVVDPDAERRATATAGRSDVRAHPSLGEDIESAFM